MIFSLMFVGFTQGNFTFPADADQRPNAPVVSTSDHKS
jgi:hypothetical protein